VSIPTVRNSDGSWAKSNEKAKAFAAHLRQVFTPHSSPCPHELVVSDSFDGPCPTSLPITPFSPAEISAMYASLSVRKAPGYALISGKLLKELPPKAVVLLTNLYNSMPRLSYYPLIWIFAKI
jgi:hypothetical protein